jgi:hypothetical protein
MKRLSLLLGSIVITVAAGFFLYAYTNVSGQTEKGWKVWVKTDPCSGLHDWVSVAKENPAYGGGGGTWANADLILSGSGMHCVRNTDESCTFANATAEAALVRASRKFSDYCCKEYSVWENNQTGKRSVVVGKFGTAGFGWKFVDGPMCCLDAEALAGIPGACSGVGEGVRGNTAWEPLDQSSLQGDTLTYYAGTTAEKCQMDCDANPKCQAFTFIKRGAYSPNAPAMCYLISRVTAAAASSCCVSYMRNGTFIAGVDHRTKGPIHKRAKKAEPNPEVDKTPAKIDDDAVDAEAEKNPESSARDNRPADLNWAGTWVGSYNQTVNISGGGSSISASFSYQQPGASGNGQWSNCRVTGNTAECNYTAHHDDATKSGTRSGKLSVTLNGDTITGTYYEDEPQWTYKGDRNASNVNSAMHKGAQFPVTFKRQ